MKITVRSPHEEYPSYDRPPFLAGMIQCDHKFNNGSMGICVHNEDLCPICRGTGWTLVPVVIEISMETEDIFPVPKDD